MNGDSLSNAEKRLWAVSPGEWGCRGLPGVRGRGGLQCLSLQQAFHAGGGVSLGQPWKTVPLDGRTIIV